MLDIKFIRHHQEIVKEGIRKKQLAVDLDKLLKLDEERVGLLVKIEELRAEQNKASREIALKLDKDKIFEMKKVKNELKDLELKFGEINQNYKTLLFKVPNLPKDDVKEGKDASENEIIRIWGEPTKFDFEPKDYMTLAEKLDLIDTERAAKVSGSRFGYLKNEVVLIEFALVQYAFEVLIKEGFIPVVPPVMIKEEAMQAMGYLEHGGEEETYHFPADKLYLVGTSEQSIGPYHMDEIFESKDLPRRYVAFSTCFRREAGSYGKDTKGILRVHQFDKVEMFSFTRKENSDEEHEFLLRLEEKLMRGLELPYRVVKMCTGDLGFTAARKYDIEVWLPGENNYRETHSTSNCTDFQARRLNIKYREGLNTKFVHTLNGTAFSIGRPLIAIIENYQTREGNIIIPQILRQYLGGREIIN